MKQKTFWKERPESRQKKKNDAVQANHIIVISLPPISFQFCTVDSQHFTNTRPKTLKESCIVFAYEPRSILIFDIAFFARFMKHSFSYPSTFKNSIAILDDRRTLYFGNYRLTTEPSWISSEQLQEEGLGESEAIKRRVLVYLCKSLILYGAPCHRIVRNLVTLSLLCCPKTRKG